MWCGCAPKESTGYFHVTTATLRATRLFAGGQSLCPQTVQCWCLVPVLLPVQGRPKSDQITRSERPRVSQYARMGRTTAPLASLLWPHSSPRDPTDLSLIWKVSPFFSPYVRWYLDLPSHTRNTMIRCCEVCNA